MQLPAVSSPNVRKASHEGNLYTNNAQEHLILVTELLRANLYEFQRYIRDAGEPVYFTLPRVQSIASQVLASRATVQDGRQPSR